MPKSSPQYTEHRGGLSGSPHRRAGRSCLQSSFVCGSAACRATSTIGKVVGPGLKSEWTPDNHLRHSRRTQTESRPTAHLISA
jgi:hypothetical protein